MRFLHSEVTTELGDAIIVSLSGTEANVMVMDDSNFRNYRSGGSFNYYGGHYRRSPAIIRPPSSGRWNVVIDLGGMAGDVPADVHVMAA